MKPWKQRFEEKFLVSPGCWNWIACTNPKGYGQFTQLRAHRVSYELYVGPIPEGLSVLHKCDNRRCVNPDHLFVGTQDDNMKDMKRKGRKIGVLHKDRRGPGRTKLSEEQYFSVCHDNRSSRKIAAELGVSHTVVVSIKRVFKGKSHAIK